MTPPAQLNELLNQPAPWEWTVKDPDGWYAKFKVGEQRYVLSIDVEEDYDMKVANVIFQMKTGTGGITTDVTGTGGSFQVFATVMDALKEFLAHHDVNAVSFSAKEPNRAKLYKRLAGMVAKEMGWEVTQRTSKWYGDHYFLIHDGSGKGVGQFNEDRIDEVLNSPEPWSWRRQEPRSWEARFDVNDVKYWVYLDGSDTDDLVSLTFTGGGVEDITGTGNSFSVFATVMAIVRDFMSHRKPQSLYFTAKEPSRRALYQRLANMAAKELGGRVTAISDGGAKGYQIILGSSDLHEDGKIIPNVNTTVDVQPGETERQAVKFGNKLDAKGRPPLLRGSYGDDSARFSANQGDPFYGDNGTRLPKNKKWT